ncbi:DUF2975 domain-containing protein [Chryseobacterium gambrini]|uniref:DUF2975 domain-containing protein n=1 Tax=Chryseobacterium gambrini TaxID=373672 RepID=UPI0022F17F90|nr:DUF2975 domain-containing protein [Chryseobacterium gambrini]WBV50708.1 DUF2975 domain-containing protein [Chryseobacterium gambrini]
MKIIGTNSLLYWLRIPFAIYVIGFIMSSLWMTGLIGFYIFSGSENRFIWKSNWEVPNNNETIASEIIQFKYPFSKMCLATENSTEGILLALTGIISFSYILFYALRITLKLSKDNFFTADIVKDLKFAGFGLIIFGFAILLIDVTNGFSKYYNSYDLTPPFFYLLFGLILIFIKEIFQKAKNIQEENELTI